MKFISYAASLPILLNLVGCAHFFSASKNDQSYAKLDLSLPYCIADKNDVVIGGEVGNAAKRGNAKFPSYLMERVKKRFPDVKFDCNASQKNIVLFTTSQKRVSADVFFLTLGIIPWIAETNYDLKITHQQQEIYKSENHGRVIMSVFFVPFFFLHNSEEEVVSDAFIDFLVAQKNAL